MSSDGKLYKIIMKIYPWVFEKDARRIAHEAETKRNDHIFDEARKLKTSRSWVAETPDHGHARDGKGAMSPLYYLPGTNIVAADQDDAKARGWPYYPSQNPNRSLPPSGTNHKSTTSWEYSHPFTTEGKGSCVSQRCPNWRGN